MTTVVVRVTTASRGKAAGEQLVSAYPDEATAKTPLINAETMPRFLRQLPLTTYRISGTAVENNNYAGLRENYIAPLVLSELWTQHCDVERSETRLHKPSSPETQE